MMHKTVGCSEDRQCYDDILEIRVWQRTTQFGSQEKVQTDRNVSVFSLKIAFKWKIHPSSTWPTKGKTNYTYIYTFVCIYAFQSVLRTDNFFKLCSWINCILNELKENKYVIILQINLKMKKPKGYEWFSFNPAFISNINKILKVLNEKKKPQQNSKKEFKWLKIHSISNDLNLSPILKPNNKHFQTTVSYTYRILNCKTTHTNAQT